MRKPEGKRVSGGGAAASGSIYHSEKSPGLSLEEKRQILSGIAQCLDDAPAILNSFKKKELRELLCAEVGKDHESSGFTKPKMVQFLLKLLSKKRKKETETVIASSSTMEDESKLNKQKKNKYLSQLPIESSHSDDEMASEDPKDLRCGNLACRAPIGSDGIFCKRCSCCICHRYDENKDPSLWLTCDLNSLEGHEPCGISCHLKCALDRKPPGNLKKGDSGNPDDRFRCIICGTPYGVMRTWRKQIVASAEARRVDVLCLRLSLGHKILIGSDNYEELLKMVESAVIALENEVGPLDQASVTMDRSIVNRLSCGAAVQKLCASALEAFDSMMGGPSLNHSDNKEAPGNVLINTLVDSKSVYASALEDFDSMVGSQSLNHSDKREAPECKILIEVISPTKVAVNLEYDVIEDLSSCRIWHRRSGTEYAVTPTYDLAGPVKIFELCDLDPSTEYSCKVSFSGKSGNLGSWEVSWKTPAALSEDQAVTDNMNAQNANTQKQTESMSSSDDLSKEPSVLFDSRKKKEEVPSILPFPKKQQVPIASPSSNAPSTPTKSDGTQEVPNSGNQRQLNETDYEYAVRVIRKLEHEGHLESDFRVKFLTWFSLKATMQEKKVVSVFVDTFSDDPSSLAGQLLHTFKDRICNDQKMASPRFCTRLWH